MTRCRLGRTSEGMSLGSLVVYLAYHTRAVRKILAP